jgi:hypothetical protein
MRWLLRLYDLAGLDPETLGDLVLRYTRLEQLKLAAVGVGNLVSAAVVSSGVYMVLKLAFDNRVFAVVGALGMALFMLNLLRLVVSGTGYARWHAEVPLEWRPSMWTLTVLMLFAVPFSQAGLLAVGTVSEETVDAQRQEMVALHGEVVLAALRAREATLLALSDTLTPAVLAQRRLDLIAEREQVLTQDLPAYTAHLAKASLLVKRLTLAWQDPWTALPISVVLGLLVLGGPLVWMIITREGQSMAIEWPARSKGLAWSYQVEQHRRDRARILVDYEATRIAVEHLLAPYGVPLESNFEDPPFNRKRRVLAAPKHRRGRLQALLDSLESF